MQPLALVHLPCHTTTFIGAYEVRGALFAGAYAIFLVLFLFLLF
jgi:hypothetical protein